MSTKSKARKKAREWMSKEIERRKVIAARARREGQEDMRRDGGHRMDFAGRRL